MKNVENVVDVAMLTVGSTYSLANIEHILGVIILIIQLTWILTKLIVKIVNTAKSNGSLDALDKNVDDVIEKLEDIKENIDSDEVDKNE